MGKPFSFGYPDVGEASSPRICRRAKPIELDIRDRRTGELVSLNRRDRYWWRHDKKRFYKRLRQRLGLPEPQVQKRLSDGRAFYWDDHEPRRLRAFIPRDSG